LYNLHTEANAKNLSGAFARLHNPDPNNQPVQSDRYYRNSTPIRVQQNALKRLTDSDNDRLQDFEELAPSIVVTRKDLTTMIVELN